MSGFLRPAAAKMSTTSSEATAREMIWRMAWSSSSSGRASPGARLASTARTAWKKPTSSRMRSASSCGTASANACDSSLTARTQRSLPSSCARMCSCAGGQQAEPLLRRAGRPLRPVEAVEEAAADLVLLQHHGDGLVLVERRLARAAALGVGGQRLLQLVGQAQVVHHQPAGLVLEHAVDARDRLHQPVAAHRLVDVHRVQARRVEAGEPHVAHDARSGTGRSGSRKRLASASRRGLLRMCGCQSSGIGGRAGHHDLERALRRRRRSCHSGRSATISW